MKSLFLDIDGVLLPGRQLYAPENAEARRLLMADKVREAGLAFVFDPACVRRLNDLCAATGAQLVVHSDWRARVGHDETRSHLVGQGVDERLLHPVRCDYDPRRGVSKADDIWKWVRANQPTKWAVVDDDYLPSYDGPLPQVMPDFNAGLTAADCAKLAVLLTGGEPCPKPTT